MKPAVGCPAHPAEKRRPQLGEISLPVKLPPSGSDVASAKAIQHRMDEPIERTLNAITLLADEKVVLGAAVLVWAYCRLGLRSSFGRQCGNDVLYSVAIAGVLPHIIKKLVNRERPDRRVVGLVRHGIPRSGNRLDSFPSGHAVHLGALAAALGRFGPEYLPIIWPAAFALAATRMLLLAHYPSDVGAGLALGVAVERAVHRVIG